jgi:benzoyl-CoA reductase subunit C
MNATLAKFRNICAQPYLRAQEWKEETNGKIIGCLPMYFPEEFIHACGMLPVTLFGTDDPVTLGNKHMMTNACGQVRTTFDSLLKNKYEFLDGLAAIHVCDQVKFFLEVWQLDKPFPFFHQMLRPYRLDDSSRKFLVSELVRLKESLEDLTGKELVASSLQNSIKVYNHSRAMMRTLNGIRNSNPGSIGALDMGSIVTSSMLIPREEHNKLLADLLSAIQKLESKKDNRKRVVLAGHPCGIPEGGLLHMIEEQNFVIVDDDFFTGARYFESDVKADGDPIEAFTDYYLNPIPCSTYHFPANWIDGPDQYTAYGDYIINKFRKSSARAVFILREMYCDPLDLEYVLLKKRFEEEEIPYLALFIENSPGTQESIRTRIQAFSETLD